MVEIIPKKTIKKEPLVNIVALWSGIILLIFVFILFSVFYFEKKKDTKLLHTLRTRIESSRTASETDLENNLQLYENKIDDASLLIDAHQEKATKIFSRLEKLIYPSIYFSNLDLQTDQMEVNVDGYADNFRDLSKQLAILENDPTIQGVILSDAKFSEQGIIAFKLNIKFLPAVLK